MDKCCHNISWYILIEKKIKNKQKEITNKQTNKQKNFLTSIVSPLPHRLPKFPNDHWRLKDCNWIELFAGETTKEEGTWGTQTVSSWTAKILFKIQFWKIIWYIRVGVDIAAPLSLEICQYQFPAFNIVE